MLKGVIFDMDGTITLSESLHHQAYAAVFKEYGVDFTFDEEIRKFAGSGSEKIFTDVFAERGITVSKDDIAKCVAKKKSLYTKIVQEAEIPVVDGAKEFIKSISARGLRRIIATGNSNLDAVRLILKKVGLLEYFPDIISITEVPRGKPFPDVFIEAAKRINCAADECVVLEDAINGVRAAKAAGMRCIALATTTKREDLLKAGADEVVKNYAEITDAVLFH